LSAAIIRAFIKNKNSDYGRNIFLFLLQQIDYYKDMVFKPRYVSINTIIISMYLYGKNIYDCWVGYSQGEGFSETFRAFLIGSGIISLIFPIAYSIYCKTVIIDYKKRKIIIIRSVLMTKSVVRFEDIKFVDEDIDTYFAGTDHLQIITDHNVFRIGCNWINNYSILRQEIYNIYEAQKKLKRK